MEFIDGNTFDGFERPEIDSLTVIEATEIIANYCLEAPDLENNAFASRMIVEGLYAAVALTRDYQADSDFDEWIYRMRLTTVSVPHDASTGLEVRLPYGIGTNTQQGIAYPHEIPGLNSGVYISYQSVSSRGWHSTELMNRSYARPFNYWGDQRRQNPSFNICRDSVSQVDKSILRTTRDLQKNDIGFNLSIALRLLDVDYIKIQ